MCTEMESKKILMSFDYSYEDDINNNQQKKEGKKDQQKQKSTSQSTGKKIAWCFRFWCACVDNVRTRLTSSG